MKCDVLLVYWLCMLACHWYISCRVFLWLQHKKGMHLFNEGASLDLVFMLTTTRYSRHIFDVLAFEETNHCHRHFFLHSCYYYFVVYLEELFLPHSSLWLGEAYSTLETPVYGGVSFFTPWGDMGCFRWIKAAEEGKGRLSSPPDELSTSFQIFCWRYYWFLWIWSSLSPPPDSRGTIDKLSSEEKIIIANIIFCTASSIYFVVYLEKLLPSYSR